MSEQESRSAPNPAVLPATDRRYSQVQGKYPTGSVYDIDRGMYVDPATGKEDPHTRRLRQIEESGNNFYDYR